ncbi:MAG: hypothetical protein K2X66_17435 [Cyanobacteria bacterium]|nr:hypothetical protein [Cyanobacteriota bacterium]
MNFFKGLCFPQYRHTHSPLFSKKVGNSLAEYALPLGVIGVLIAVGFSGVGSGFQGFLQNSFNGSFNASSNPSGTFQSKSLQILPMGTNPYTSSVSLTLQDGTRIVVPNYPTDLNKLIETLGPNGATDTMAESFRNLAKALLAEGKITPAEANLLSNLSNRGHDLAKNQRILEDFANSSGSDSEVYTLKSKDFRQIQNLSNQSVTLLNPDIRTYIGLGTQITNVVVNEKGKVVYDTNGDAILDHSKFYDYKIPKDQFDFLKEFGSVMQSKLFQEPVLKQAISALTINIYQVSSLATAYSNRVADSSFSLSPNLINQKISQSVRRDSVALCSVGGGVDSGVQCPKQKSN